MPSYRRDRPERRGPPPRPHHAHAEEEAEEAPRSFLRRPPGQRDPSSPPRPAERGSWSDFIVPESEKADPHFSYSRVWSVWEPGRGRGRESAAPPPPPRSESYQARTQSERPVVDPELWFNQGRIWNAVQTVRADSRFHPGRAIAIMQLPIPASSEATRQENLSRMFGMAVAELPIFLDDLTYAINHGKPREIPGRVRFGPDSKGFYWLWYDE